jgi:hypothetical protein
MTLDRDRKKNLRPPMRRGTFIVIIAIVVAVFGYVVWWTITNGPPLF